MSQAVTKKLAKNTFFLYFRMFSLMIISLYTSRVVLYQLGVEDFGIYNFVFSLTAIFTSLKGLFASTTQRFLNNAMGKGEHDTLQKIFSISVVIHLLIAIVFLILVEGFGLWFFQYEINVPDNRLFAAGLVFQISIATAILDIITIPFDAEIIAHEKMGVYAYFAIFEGIAKLAIAFLLSIVEPDKLVIYAMLVFFVQLVIRFITYLYCKRTFEECHYQRANDKKLFLEMSKFAGWQFFGNTSYTVIHNGTNMILNVFGGPIVNAARGVTFQVNGALTQFLSNIQTAFNPHCVKLYANGEENQLVNMVLFMSKIMYFVQLCLVVPLFILADEILSFWLVEVPEYTLPFLRIVFIWSLVRSFHSPMDTFFKAVGNIKYYQMFEGFFQCLMPICAYVALKYGLPYSSAFIIMVIFELLSLIGILCIAHHITGFNIYLYVKKVILPCISITSVFFVNTIIMAFYSLTFAEKFGLAVLAEILIFVLLLVAILTKSERDGLKNLLPFNFSK